MGYEKESKEGRKEMFHLMKHSTHLRLYCVEHTVKDHLYKEKISGVASLMLFDQQQGLFYKYHHLDRLIHTASLVIPFLSMGPLRAITQ